MDEHIKIIQNTYQKTYDDIPQPMIVNKEKQKEDRVQDKEVFLYEHYNILSKSSKPKTPEPKFIQDEVNNLEVAMTLLQSPTKMILFYLLSYYKSL